jgi:outer membrane murein-binding lipoprotein Lpp
MRTNSTKLLTLGIFLLAGVLTSGCSVGAKIAVSASDVQYPVSQTNSFYSQHNHLITEDQYEALKEFGFTFTKWGVSSMVELKNSEDISNRLNKIIEKHDGDAIVNLRISVNNPTGKNGLLWFSKTLTVTSSVLFTFLAISDPQPEFTAIAIGSTVVALFTPAAADILVEGTVVRITELSSD